MTTLLSEDTVISGTFREGGKLVVAGQQDENIVLFCYNLDGTPDTTFRDDGTGNLGSGFPTSVTEEPDGTFLVYGTNFIDHYIGSPSSLQYLLTDGHGSTQQITDSEGFVTSTFSYDAFGTALNFNAATAGTQILFGGDAIYDPVSGLYMHGDGTRDTLGFLFIQMDTTQGSNSDPISLHKYLYADADPIDGIDPSGDDDSDDEPDAYEDLLFGAVQGEGVDPTSVFSVGPNGALAFTGEADAVAEAAATTQPGANSITNGVFIINRIIGTHQVVPFGTVITHTYVATTDASGHLLHTYSWGNAPSDANWMEDTPEDTKAATDALNYGSSYYQKITSGIIPSDVNNAYNMKNYETHPNQILFDNCKTEASELIMAAEDWAVQVRGAILNIEPVGL